MSRTSYDGDGDVDSASNLPEFTLRSVLLGLAVGCLLCFTNLQFGLQTGWISMMSLQSALIGYLVGRTFRSGFSPQENVVVQTTAVATGTMPLAAGFVGIIPALGLLRQDTDGSPPLDISWLQGVGWSLAVAFFGVFLAAPLRKQVIVKEQLAFPSGTATAQLISVLHQQPIPTAVSSLRRRQGYQALEADELPETTEEQSAEEEDQEAGIIKTQGWSALLWSFAVSAVLTLCAYFFPVVFAIPLFGTYLAREWLWSFSPSLSYIGQGIIMGFPTTLSMSLGMFVGWAILSPIAKHEGWAPGPVGDMATGARAWILWISLAIMCTDSVISLLPVVWEFIADQLSKQNGAKDPDGADGDNVSASKLVPAKWVIWGMLGSIGGGTILVWLVFGNEGIKFWATIIGFIMACFLSVLGVRALGETDLNPVSGLGKLSQFVFAFIQPGNVVANIIAGGVAEAGAQQAGDLMQDLKTGHLLQASPRAQFYGQLIGSAVSIVVTTTAYSLYTRAYTIPGKEFPAPTAFVWLNLARLLRDGSLPPRTGPFMAAFSAAALLTSAAKAYATRRGVPWAKWIPSGVAFAIGFLNAPSFSISRLLGGLAEFLYRRHLRRTHAPPGADIKIIIVASGFVLGEGVTSVVGLVLRTFGIGALSCFGCGTGICAGCPASLTSQFL